MVAQPLPLITSSGNHLPIGSITRNRLSRMVLLSLHLREASLRSSTETTVRHLRKFTLLGELRPQADSTQASDKRVLSILEKVLDQSASSSSTLPQSSTVNQLMTKMFDPTSETWTKLNWSQSKIVLDVNCRPKSYVCHSEVWPGDLPKLDKDAGRLHISSEKTASLPVSTLGISWAVS